MSAPAPPMSEAQLAEDREKIRAFRASLDRYADITSGIVNVLGSFETRLQELEAIILPLHEITQGSSVAHQNIEATVAQVDDILARFDAPNEVGPRILKGIGNDLEGFLAAVDKVRETLLFFGKNDDIGGAAAAVETLRELQSRALRALEEDFKRALAKISNAADPSRLLPQGTGSAGDAAAAAADAVPAATAERLSKLVARLEKWKKSKYLEIYTKLRGEYLHESLLKLNPSSIAMGGSDAEAGTGPASAATGKKGRRGKEEGAGLPYQRGTHRGIRFVRCFAVLVQAESALVGRLLGRKAAEGGTAFDECTEEAVGLFRMTLQRIVGMASTAQSGRELLFPLLDLFDVYSVLREECPVVQELSDAEGAYIELGEEAYRIYGAMEQEVAQHPSSVKDVPPDATVHQLTSTTVGFLRRLCDYAGALPRLLAASRGGSRRGGTKAAADLASYAPAVLRALERNLQDKAAAYRTAAQGFLFAANNQHYVAKNAATEPLASLLGPKPAASFEALCKESLKRYYEATCGAALAYVRGDVVGKEEIKAAFKGFNEALAEQERAQARWAVPDPDLRKQIRQELVKGRLLPGYSAFHAKFANVYFSKHPEKYVRHAPSDLAAVVARFFGEGPAA